MAQSYEDGLTQLLENLTGDGLGDLSITASDNLPDIETPSLDLGGLVEMGMLPTVSSVTTSVNVMGDDGVLDRSDIGLSSFTISITFDQAMNTSVLPVISFPTLGENPGALLTFSGFVWSNGNQTYSATFTVNDIELEVADLDVQISDARNNAGETMASVTITDVFSIDTDADVGDDLSITFNDGNGFIDSSEDISAVDFSVAGLDSGSTAVATFTGLDNMGMVLSTTVNISANGALSVDLTGFAQGTVTASIMTTDAAGNTTSGAGDSSIIDSSADLDGNLSLSVNTIAVNGADSGMIAFDVSGLDGDLTSATVTFSDGDTDVVVDVSGGDGSYMADISGLSDGNITSTLNVTDGADNTASDTGANIAMDRTADEGGDLALTISDTVINEDEAGSVSFDIAGLDADIATAVVTFTDGVDSVTVDVSGGNGTYSADLSMLSDGTITSSLAVTDNAGNTAGDTGADITLDTMDPNAPIVTGITDDTGSSATDGITSDDDLTISGTAEANSSVDVYVDGELLGTVMANNFGDWSIVFNTVPMPPPYGSEFVAHLPDGTYSITATATDAAGNVSATSSAFTIMVDTMDPNAPVISTSITNDAGVSDADGTTTDATPTLTITAEAGTSVEVFIDGVSAGFATETMTAGTFTFTPAMALAADVYNFTAISTDAAGNDSAASAAVSLTITDAPIINGLTDSANMVTMDGLNDGVGTAVDGDAPANATASGTIAFEDFAAGQTHSVTAILPPAGAFGSFSASLTNSATDDGLGEVTWTFSVANSDIDHLDAGDTITQNYTVRITDDMGNETEQAITVIILGTDDAAVITADETGAVSEGDIGDPAVTATGSIAVSDADDDDTPSFANAADTGLYGSIVVNATGDGWTYTLDQSTVQDLDDMEVVTDTLTLIDDEGNEVDIVITITGTDDAAIITGDVTGTVTEGNIGDAAVTATGAIGVSDVDGDDDPSFANASAMGLYGMLVVNSAGDEWTYTLDQSTVQDLDDYDMVTDTVTLTDDEGNTRDIVITIIGTADDAVITADTTGAVNEGDIGDIVTTTGAIAVSDLDDDDMPSFANATDTGLYGSISVSSAGDQWTYTLDQASVQDLNAGDMIVDTVTLIDDEGNMVDIDITITGTNDGPVITTPMGGNEGAVTEDAPVVADLTPLPTGMDILVNTTTTGRQTQTSIAALADGGFVVTFTDNSGEDGDGQGVFGQRFDAMGVAVGAEFQVNTTTTGTQEGSSVTALADGGFVVTFTDQSGADGSGWGVFGQRFDSMGVAVGTEFQVNTATTVSQFDSTVTALADGGFVVTFSDQSGADGDGFGVLGQRYDAMGMTVGTEFVVNTTMTSFQNSSSVAALADGGFVVTFTDSSGADGDGNGVLGQRFDAMGVAVGAEFVVNTTTVSSQSSSNVTALADGGFVVTFTDSSGADGDGQGVFGQRFDAMGVAVGNEFQVNTTINNAQSQSNVTALSDGGFVVTFTDNSRADGSQTGIFGQRFDAMGMAVGNEFLINDTTAGRQIASSVVELADGRLAVTFYGDETGSNNDVFVRLIDMPVAGPITNSTTGQITADDVDAGAALTFTGDATGTYGAFVIDSMTGEWTFTLDEMDPDTNALTEGQIVTETFTVTVTDDQMATTTQDVTITITGTNDAATITASMMEDTSVTEAGGDNPGGTLGDPDAGGTLSVSDVDTGEDVFEAVMAAELVGDYGTFTFDEMTGAWTYILDNNNATVQALSDGDMLTDTLTVSSLDGTDSFDIDVTINGVNDAAIVVAPSDLSGNVTELPDGDANENTGTVSTSGTILFDDETADTHNVTFTAVTGPGTVGDVVDYIGTFSSNFTQDSTGLLTGQIDWTFTVDDALLDSLGDGETLTQLYEYTITDNNGAVLTQIVTITITGSNDAATVSGLSSDTVDEFAANGTVVGTVVLTDVDSSGGPVSYALTDDADGRFAINATTGEITVADSLALDFEQNISHFITVEVTEGSETSMQIVEINVTDVNGPEIIIADDLGRTLIGDDFNDNFTGGLGADIFIGGGGDDILSGGGGSDILDGGDGMDTLSGGAGADRFIGGDGADSHDGGGGFDTLDYSGASSAVHLNLISGGTLGDAAGDSYVSIENVDGSDFDDIITGSSGANVINGNDGNDRLFGEAGNDRLFGGDGVDRLDGGEGNDILSGGLGVDIFFGGAGADLHLGGAGVDTIDYRAASSAIVVNLSTGGTMGDAAGDTFFGVERVLGSENFNDHITGGSTSDNLHGRGGDDYIHGGSSGNDSLFGQGGVDSFGYDTGTGRRDIINDFEAGALNNEVVYILGGDPNFDSFAEIMAVATDVGGNVVFDFGGGNRLTFIGLQVADFDIGDFDFSGTPPPAGPPPGGNENLELAEEIFVDDVAMSMDMDALI